MANSFQVENPGLKISTFLLFMRIVLCFFIFFPYVTPIDTPWSLQPYAMLISLFFLLIIKHKKINKQIVILLFVSLSSIIISFFSLSDFINSIRSIANYVSLPIIIWAVYIYGPSGKSILTFVRISAYLYFLVGCIQFFFIPNFLSFLVPHQSTESLFHSGRGVSSLTPEPSYFGFTMLLFFFIALLLNDKLIKLIAIFSILFLAQSFAAISCFLIVILILFLFKNATSFFLTILVSIIFFITLNRILVVYNLESRALILVENIINNGFSSTINDDASATGRLFHITYPISESFYHFFIPFGYDGLPNGDTRILSGIGGAVYELGFISFLLIYSICNIIFYRNNLNLNYRLGIGIGLIVFLFNANQIGMPIFAYILALYLNSRKLSL